ncbi:glycosyltransferase family 2 protein [Synechocystis sp. LKSZ1]|uniref:glycosyltransferase family 2 protein n=1 Tax=Synechocystis sp. LKSZ1 TaxID=3144951 RepID=UPI00336C225C
MTSPSAIELSVVIPMYNEGSSLEKLFERLLKVLDGLALAYEVLCVNDGSRDNTLMELVRYHQQNPAIKVINLSRNFGKEIALSAGIDFAQGQAVIPIDADLQDPPELIPVLIQKWREGFDVVYATRRTRQGETWFKRRTAEAFYQTIGRMTPIGIPANTGDFRLMNRPVVEALKQLPERTRFMKGLFAWVGYRQTSVLFDREPRFTGKSKWNYWKLWNFALDGIISFSLVPLKVWSYLGLLISLLSLFYASYLVLRTIVLGIDVPGYASLMVAILFLGGVQLISLGVIGEYLGRVYEEVKARPLYLVRDTWGLDTITKS